MEEETASATTETGVVIVLLEHQWRLWDLSQLQGQKFRTKQYVTASAQTAKHFGIDSLPFCCLELK